MNEDEIRSEITLIISRAEKEHSWIKPYTPRLAAAITTAISALQYYDWGREGDRAVRYAESGLSRVLAGHTGYSQTAIEAMLSDQKDPDAFLKALGEGIRRTLLDKGARDPLGHEPAERWILRGKKGPVSHDTHTKS